MLVLAACLALVLQSGRVVPPNTSRKNSKKNQTRDCDSSPNATPSISAHGAAHGPIAPFVGKVVGAIDVTGLKRIEKDAVLAKLTSKVGAKLSADQVRTDIQAIYGMGFFDDIEIQAEHLPEGKVNSSTPCASAR